MKKLSLEERLAVYEQALIDYMADAYYTNNGFCYYFKNVVFHNLGIYTEFKQMLPELFSTFINKSKHTIRACKEYGNVPERHECLKKAIKITKAKIKKQKTVKP